MELHKEQVGRIDQFLKDQRVRYIDVRLELVDHIATEIESGIDGQDYDQAITSLPARYYPSQLSQIVEKKALTLGKFWEKELKQFWKSYVTFPRIMLAILLVFILSIIGQIEIDLLEKNLLQLSSIVVSIIGMILFIAKWIKTLYYRSLLIEHSLYTMVFIFFAFGPSSHPIIEFFGSISSQWLANTILSTYTAFQIITIIGLLFDFPKFIDSKMKMTYG